MADYPLRNVDNALWARVRARADRDGLTVRALIVALLRGYVAGEITVRGADADEDESDPSPPHR